MASNYMGGGSMLRCPGCQQHTRVAVIDSRSVDPVFGRKRRRACLACHHRWTTVEVPYELVLGLRELGRTVESMQACAQLMQQTFDELALPDLT